MSEKLPKQSVLVVDDNPENINILSNILSQDYKVKFALSGTKALEIAQSDDQPDLILLDIMMPGMDGYQVCKKLKGKVRTRNIPVIFVTARDDVLDETKGFNIGAIDYITKPVSPPIVKARVRNHLALYNQSRLLEDRVEQRTAELHDTRLEIIRHLGRAAEFRDYTTGMHVIRVSHYCEILGLAAGMIKEEAELLLNAAPMHDIGKIGIPDKILLKKGKLNGEEWEIMKSHSEIGAHIIGDHSSEILEMAKIIALTHHERWDGQGYPQGLCGTDIPLIGRIIAIADVFDALTCDRPYKKGWSVDEAIEYIRDEKDKHFDPNLADMFLNNTNNILEISNKYSDKSNHAELH